MRSFHTPPPGLSLHRLSSGLWELRTPHRTLGLYVTKHAADAAKRRLRRRGRRCTLAQARR